MAIYKRFNVLVLLACDGDYVPLARKLNTLGTRVMLLQWDFKYTDREGRERETRTAQGLIDEVTYPIAMHMLIDDRSLRDDAVISGLFYHPKTKHEAPMPKSAPSTPGTQSETDLVIATRRGKINNLKEGFGFVTDSTDRKSRFFHHSSVADDGFSALKVGDNVEVTPIEEGRNGRAENLRVIAAPA